MDIFWDKSAWEDYRYWIDNDRKVLKKINALIKECQRTPFAGTGKPEALKQNLSGYWSRRITGEHRLVYKVEDEVLYIAQCRYHY
ncbi:MAG: Txe/YoeB family addiction module toxin [Mangrovibacterium sp.]